MSLSRLEFLVLNNLADEPEPFSELYVDVLQDLQVGEDDETGFEDVATAVSGLCERGLVQPVDGAAEDASAIAAHYAALDDELMEFLEDELAHEMGFAYSRGEWGYQMTTAGESEWQNPDYARYFPEEG